MGAVVLQRVLQRRAGVPPHCPPEDEDDGDEFNDRPGKKVKEKNESNNNNKRKSGQQSTLKIYSNFNCSFQLFNNFFFSPLPAIMSNYRTVANSLLFSRRTVGLNDWSQFKIENEKEINYPKQKENNG